MLQLTTCAYTFYSNYNFYFSIYNESSWSTIFPHSMVGNHNTKTEVQGTEWRQEELTHIYGIKKSQDVQRWSNHFYPVNGFVVMWRGGPRRHPSHWQLPGSSATLWLPFLSAVFRIEHFHVVLRLLCFLKCFPFICKCTLRLHQVVLGGRSSWAMMYWVICMCADHRKKMFFNQHNAVKIAQLNSNF